MPRIQVYADQEMKRRIELAAARQNMAVTHYCLEAIQQRLADEDMLENERIEIPIKPEVDPGLIPDLRSLRERILEQRGGEPVDIDEILDDVRSGRDDELLSMR